MKNNERNVILEKSFQYIIWEPWHLCPDDMRVFSVTDFRFAPLITYFVYQIRCAWWSMEYWNARKTAVASDKWYLSEGNAFCAALVCYNRPTVYPERDANAVVAVLDPIPLPFIRPRAAR